MTIEPRIVSGAITINDKLVGTAWRAGPNVALTAAHCLRIGLSKEYHEFCKIVFPDGCVNADVRCLDVDLDIAVIDFSPRCSSWIDLEAPPWGNRRLVKENKPPWHGYGYPESKPSGLELTGKISSFSEREGLGLQLSCDQGNEFLTNASGTAIVYRGCAIAVLSWHPVALAGKVVYAISADKILKRFPFLCPSWTRRLALWWRRRIRLWASVVALLVMIPISSTKARRATCHVAVLDRFCAAAGILGEPSLAEQTLWNDALKHTSSDGLRAYLRTYPRGAYSMEARSRLDGCRIEERLGTVREVTFPLTINPNSQRHATRKEAQADAVTRGQLDADSLCNAQDGPTRVLGARVEPRSDEWRCNGGEKLGFTCGFTGDIVCRVQNRIRSEQCS